MISTVPTVPYIFEYSDGRYVTQFSNNVVHNF